MMRNRRRKAFIPLLSIHYLAGVWEKLPDCHFCTSVCISSHVKGHGERSFLKSSGFVFNSLLFFKSLVPILRKMTPLSVPNGQMIIIVLRGNSVHMFHEEASFELFCGTDEKVFAQMDV